MWGAGYQVCTLYTVHCKGLQEWYFIYLTGLGRILLWGGGSGLPKMGVFSSDIISCRPKSRIIIWFLSSTLSYVGNPVHNEFRGSTRFHAILVSFFILCKIFTLTKDNNQNQIIKIVFRFRFWKVVLVNIFDQRTNLTNCNKSKLIKNTIWHCE